MKKNQDRKYPVSLFVMGFILNLTRNVLLLFFGFIFLFIGIWVKWCLLLGISLLLSNVAISLIQQIQIRNTTLNSDDPNFREWQDSILSSDWKDNVMNMVESKINDSDDDEDEEFED